MSAGGQAVIDREIELMRWFQGRDGELVAIDGYQGAGKSTIARRISETHGVPICHLDDHVAAEQGMYFGSIDLDGVRAAIGRGATLVEGVCLCQVLQALRIPSYRLIYVDSAPPPPRTRLGQGPLAKEVSDYHRAFAPRSRADVIYRARRFNQEEHMEQSTVTLDVAYINAKTRIAITLAIGGMMTLCVGLVLLFFGISSQDHTLVRLAGVELSAGGLGGVIMTASVVWAFLAYKASPSYARSHQVTERYGSGSKLLERTETQSSTQLRVHPAGGAPRQGAP